MGPRSREDSPASSAVSVGLCSGELLEQSCASLVANFACVSLDAAGHLDGALDPHEELLAMRHDAQAVLCVRLMPQWMPPYTVCGPAAHVVYMR